MSSNELIRPDNPPESAQISASAVDTTIQLTETVLAVVKEVGEMLNGIPYVKSLSGVILQIIKVRDELRINKKRCGEIVDKVMRMAKKIFEKLAEVAKSHQRDKLAKLEEQLKEHERTLIGVYAALKKHQSRSWFNRFINRGLDELNEHDRRLDELKTDIILDVIFHITMEQASGTNAPAQPHANTETSETIDHVLPPKPHLLIERDVQVEQALEILLRQDTTRIAILGGGGFGKTTLARTILHEPRIVERFQARYFLSCEGMSDADTLLLGLGAMIGIKEVPSSILSSVRRSLQMSTTLLCLDNFETSWEAFETRTKTEELLESISGIPNVSLMITIRGEQRPSKVAWSKPLLFPLTTLSFEGARVIVTEIAGEDAIDKFTNELLEDIDGIPLAITLIATLLRDGEDSESLWTRWSMDSTRVINVGDDRQSNLDRSIALSVNSSRMTKNPEARLLLAALSLLPDGFLKDDLESLQDCLGVSSIRTILQTLRTVALVHVDTDTSSRIQMLSPIRMFCRDFLAQEVTQTLPKTVNYYLNLLLEAKNNYGNNFFYQRITSDIRNMNTLLKLTLGSSQDFPSPNFRKAFHYFTGWATYLGHYPDYVLELNLLLSRDDPVYHAHTLFSVANLYLRKAHYNRAMEYFQQAAELFQQEKKPGFQADSLEYYGELLAALCQLDKAEDVLKTCLKLNIAENRAKGKANADFKLAKIFTVKDQYFEAEEHLICALKTYEELSDSFGRADVTVELCRLHLHGYRDLNKAEEFANHSIEISKEVNYIIAEARALQLLGQIYLENDRVMDACHALERSLSISKNQKSTAHEIEVAADLARVYIQLDRLSEGEQLLEHYSRMDTDIIFLGFVLVTFGWLCTLADRLDKAECHLNAALQCVQRFKSPSGEASVLAYQGIMYLKSNQLDKAEQVVHSISELGNWRDINMVRFWVLGDLHIIKGQFDDAQTLLDSAMVSAKSFRCSYQQGNIIRSHGILHIKHNAIDLAIEKFKEALELHRKAQWISEQATDLKRLGEAYKMLERSEEAKEAFKEAEELMESVREARQLSD